MSVLDTYREEDYNVRIEPGKHQLKIVKAEEKTFNSGNEGLKIELVNRDKVKFFYHIIANDLFNQNLTRFYDCFKIRRGETNLDKWIGRYGWAHIDSGKPNNEGKTFMEIKYLIPEEQPKADSPAPGNPLDERRKELVADINAVMTRLDPDGLPYFTEQEKKAVQNTVARCGPYDGGIRALEKEKLRIASLLKEREAGYKPVPGWDDAPAGDGDGFKDDVPIF
jgi:hypothetical protein